MNELSFSQDLTKYNRVMADLMDAAGARGDGGKRFVKKQAGLLTETLMKISPPGNRSKSSQKIKGRVNSAFHILGSESNDTELPTGPKAGHGDVRWYLWTAELLAGVAKDADFTHANTDQIYNFYYNLNKKGMIRAGMHGKQNIRIWQKTTIKRSQASKLGKRVIGHLGRLKAAYLPSYEGTAATGSIYRVPEWVRKHRSGAHGRFQDDTNTPQKPSVVITNFAKGVGKTKDIIRTALAIRIKAMKADMQLYIRGVKQRYGV